MTTKSESVAEALKHGQLVDITTTGRRTGEARRLEIVFHNIDGRLYISGMPSPKRRSWLANLDAQPNVYFTTSHYDRYPAVLVRLEAIGPAELERLLAAAWRFVAPPRLARTFVTNRPGR